jgi:hypothetical protein
MKLSPNKGSFSFLGEDGMNDEAVTIIFRYLEECLFEPMKNWPKEEFEKRSYERWAAYEIVESLMDHPFATADTVISEFIVKMICFANLAKEQQKQQFIFAIDVAETIQSLLM